MLRHIIIIVSLVLSSNNVYSCAGAFQRKLFPLGEENGNYLFREVEFQRTSEGLSMKISTRLLYFNAELKLEKAFQTDSALYNLDTFYLNQKKYLKTLVWQDLKIKNKFTSIEYAYADYLDSTSFAQVREHIDSAKVYFKFTGQKEREIKFHPIIEHNDEFFDGISRPENCPYYLMMRGIHLGMISKLTLGEKSLIIVHLCNSDALGDPEMDWKHVEQPFKKLKSYSYELDGMASHSYGSDVIFWE